MVELLTFQWTNQAWHTSQTPKEEFSSTMERNGESGQEEPAILVPVQMVNSGSLVQATQSGDGQVAQMLLITRVMEDGVKSMERQ